MKEDITREEFLASVLLDTQMVLNETLSYPNIMLRAAITALASDNAKMLAQAGIRVPDKNERVK